MWRPHEAGVCPVDDAAVLARLKGQHIMGVYAMLDDETCWFLAVDFDKNIWAEHVRAFVIERSRSGKAAHALAGRSTAGASEPRLFVLATHQFTLRTFA